MCWVTVQVTSLFELDVLKTVSQNIQSPRLDMPITQNVNCQRRLHQNQPFTVLMQDISRAKAHAYVPLLLPRRLEVSCILACLGKIKKRIKRNLVSEFQTSVSTFHFEGTQRVNTVSYIGTISDAIHKGSLIPQPPLNC